MLETGEFPPAAPPSAVHEVTDTVADERATIGEPGIAGPVIEAPSVDGVAVIHGPSGAPADHVPGGQAPAPPVGELVGQLSAPTPLPTPTEAGTPAATLPGPAAPRESAGPVADLPKPQQVVGPIDQPVASGSERPGVPREAEADKRLQVDVNAAERNGKVADDTARAADKPAAEVETNAGVKASEAKTPDHKAPTAKTPEVRAPAKTPDSKVPETKAEDVKPSEAEAPTAKTPDVKAPAAKAPEVKVPKAELAVPVRKP